MDFTNIQERTALDNYIENAASQFPENSDDFLFYVRMKESEGELKVLVGGNEDFISCSLLNISLQNEIVCEQVKKAFYLLMKHEQSKSIKKG